MLEILFLSAIFNGHLNLSYSDVGIIIHFQLRLLNNELSIEEVIRNRTTKILHEKCRDHPV